MENASLLNQDNLSQESAEIIRKLLPILDITDPTSDLDSETRENYETLRLKIPHLGLVNIHPYIKRIRDTQLLPNSAQFEENLDFQQFISMSDSLEASVNENSELPNLTFVSDEHQDTNILVQIEPQDQGDDFNILDLTAEAESWPFQGVDTNFWSLLHSNMRPES